MRKIAEVGGSNEKVIEGCGKKRDDRQVRVIPVFTLFILHSDDVNLSRTPSNEKSLAPGDTKPPKS